MISKKVAQSLFDIAIEASKASYSPYSKFPVGAAVLTKKGKIFQGTNVENASFGLTNCAERVAICNAVAAGNKDIAALAVYSSKDGVSPCGACRQFIIEFGDDIEVIYRNKGKIKSIPIRQLVPDSFNKRRLRIR